LPWANGKPWRGSILIFRWLTDRWVFILGSRIFEDALQAVNSVTPGTSHLGWQESMFGILYLGTEKYDEAAQHFDEAKKLGLDATESHAAVFAAKRQFDKIDPDLVKAKQSDVEGQDVTSQNARVTFAVDQGRWTDVWALLDKEKIALPSGETHKLESSSRSN
jgi:hypothetical protein